jgi:hypothetical protein
LLDEVFDPFSLYNYCSPVEGEHFFAGVAQLVEQLIRNQQVSGSSPLAGLNLKGLARRIVGLFSCLGIHYRSSLILHSSRKASVRKNHHQRADSQFF